MAFRYRLRPDASQLAGCERHCADARYVWNLALEQANCWRRGRRPSPGGAERNRQLAEARQCSWLGEGSSSVQQQALRDFDQAVRNWWAGTHRRPTWRGVVHTVATGAGEHLDIPSLGPGEGARLLRLERKQARQQKGSNRRARTKHAIAALHGRVADRRKDWVEKTSTRLVIGHDLVAFEDLRVKDMLRSARGTVEAPGRKVAAKAGLNRRIAASGWSMLVRRTQDKAEASMGCAVVVVDPRFTSQRCSACDHVAAGNRPSQAEFRCLVCAHCDNADVNAAKNILAAGLAVAARGGRPEVRVPGEARTTRMEAA